MSLNVIFQGEAYELTFTEDVLNKLDVIKTNLNTVIQELQKGEVDILQSKIGEPFFLTGEEFAIEGIRNKGEILLLRVVSSQNII
ncbi:hypothetical protein SMD22_00515 (plasmid) [Brevibacillus halotolerans]|nr:hypothetical protein SMD22_00515 [Brevibacillus halotolerans]